MEIVGRQPLPHNEHNAVTTSVERVETADGRILVRKRIGRHKAELARALAGVGRPAPLELLAPRGRRLHQPAAAGFAGGHRAGDPAGRRSRRTRRRRPSRCGSSYVGGTPGHGRSTWPTTRPWPGAWVAGRPGRRSTSPGAHEASSGPTRRPSRRRYELVDDDEAWAQPIIRDCWPGRAAGRVASPARPSRAAARRARATAPHPVPPRRLGIERGPPTRRHGGAVRLVLLR